MKRIFISGAMTGLPGLNYAAFNTAAARLRAANFTVFNPAENHAPHCNSWLGYMRLAVTQMAQCDAIVQLTGWEKSRGARVEHQLAVNLGLLVVDARHVPELHDSEEGAAA